jgi:hypothetical protein
MASRPEMRMPYGPGWDDPDWTPLAPPRPHEPAADTRPHVSTLAQFMAVVKRATKVRRSQPGLRVAPIERRHPVAGTAAYVGQTRRWVIAGGAGLLAISTIPALPGEARAASAAKADEPSPGDESKATAPVRNAGFRSRP